MVETYGFYHLCVNRNSKTPLATLADKVPLAETAHQDEPQIETPDAENSTKVADETITNSAKSLSNMHGHLSGCITLNRCPEWEPPVHNVPNPKSRGVFANADKIARTLQER